MKKGTSVSQSFHNVIRLPMDANFFFERAVSSLEKYRYDKALKYFRLAVEKEPDNPVNYCNLAAVLSEVGRFDESNDVLRYVLDHVDPQLVECYYYMANNAANMEYYEEAELHLLHYLQAAPDGEYSDEAREMLSVLGEELGRPPLTLEDYYEDAWSKQHEFAWELLENGQFASARDVLQQIVDEYPDSRPVRNNLALAHYYLGDIERAIEVSESVLAEEPGNLHALCNLALFNFHLNKHEHVRHYVSILKKCVPFNEEHRFKLATTMGILQQHEQALSLFRQLQKNDGSSDPMLLHNTAAAAFNTGRFELARRLWKKAMHLDRKSGIPAFYLHHLAEWSHMEPSERPVISYHYHVPLERHLQLLRNESSRSLFPDQFNDPVIRASLFWGLAHGDKQTKLQVIQALGHIGDTEVERVLRDYLLQKNEDSYLKRVALVVLRNMRAKGPFTVWLDGQKVVVDTFDMENALPVWKSSWQAVLDRVLEKMEDSYDMIQKHDAQVLWLEYLRKTYPDVPIIRKVDGWAAALEYLIGKLYGHSLTQTEIAQKYNVSRETVGRNARQIEAVCRVFRQMRDRPLNVTD